MPNKITIDAEDFTLGEVESLNREGITLADIEAGDLLAMLGLVLLHLRRSDPEATMDDARAVKLSQFAIISESEDPTPASLRTPPSTPISTGSARRSSKA